MIALTIFELEIQGGPKVTKLWYERRGGIE